VDLSIVIEPVAGNGYRATGTGGLTAGLTVEATTREEAITKIRELIRSRITAGAEILPVRTAPSGPHPWSQDAGYLRGDPMLDAWRTAIEEYRQRLDEDPDHQPQLGTGRATSPHSAS
jgi:hypothetical protein